MSARRIALLQVRRAIGPAHCARALVAGRAIPCVIGRAGMRPAALKREGDGTTPMGRFRIVRIWRRADRWRSPAALWPERRIARDDGWCETPDDRRYNRSVKLEPSVLHDRLWRDDRLYDLVIEIDHNRVPRVRGRGSAVFLHLCRPERTGTAGCVAFDPGDLAKLLPALARHVVLDIR